jgi:hypothetical protein
MDGPVLITTIIHPMVLDGKSSTFPPDAPPFFASARTEGKGKREIDEERSLFIVMFLLSFFSALRQEQQ